MVAWNLNTLYNRDDTEKLLKQQKEKVAQFVEWKKKLSASLTPLELKRIMKLKMEITELQQKLGCYAQLWFSENTSDQERTAYARTIDQACSESSAKMIFFSNWFKKLPKKKAAELIQAVPEHAYVLTRTRELKKYTLTEQAEQVIILKENSGSSALSKLYDIITSRFRYDFKGKTLVQEELCKLRMSQNREERKLAHDLLFKKYGEEESVLGEIYAALVADWNNEQMLLRKHKSALDVRNVSNNVSGKAVNMMLTTVRKNISVFHEYFKIKAKILNLPKMDRYDLYAPYPTVPKKYSFEQARKLVLDTYRQFSPKMYEYAARVFDEQHVHSEVLPHKRSGAYCMSITPTIAPYVLLNFLGERQDVFTMMHELGHAIHSLSAHDKTIFTFHSGLPLAETASTFGEMLLATRLLREASSVEEKRDILIHMLDEQYALIQRQSYFTFFEIEAHKKITQGSGVEELNKLYYAQLKEQFPFAVDEIFQHEWKFIPHIFHTPFYCYAYVFGEMLVLSLFEKYREEGEGFVPKYLKILSDGGSKPPAEILEAVGINLESEKFWEKGFVFLQTLIDELKATL